MKRISSILLLALMGAGMFVSAQEEAAGPAPAQGKVSRDRVSELMGLGVKLDQSYTALRESGVVTATGVYVEAKGRIASTLEAIEKNPAKKISMLEFSACSAHVASAFIQFEREANVLKVAKMNESRDSLLSVLHNIHETISRIEGGRAYNLAQELEVSRAKSSLLQGDLEATKANLAAERARLRKVMHDAQKRFSELQSAMISVSKDARGTIISMSDILFETNKAALTPNLKENLAKIAGILIVYKEPNIIVEGHTDNVGHKDYNQKLSEDRANAVRNYLVEQGVAETRLTAVGHGLDKPIADNATKEGKAKNRRVDLVIEEKVLNDEVEEVEPATTPAQAPAPAPAPAHAPAPASAPAPAKK
jgi:outer membrane protein OmpA-like peptidoglycan-associated protein